jgi:3-hydroxyanthranilate 3,4-dioxygenase
MEAVYQVDAWYEANKELFFPPVCNKLQHKKQLTVMFVGGPNVRTDFHLDEVGKLTLEY